MYNWTDKLLLLKEKVFLFEFEHFYWVLWVKFKLQCTKKTNYSITGQFSIQYDQLAKWCYSVQI